MIGIMMKYGVVGLLGTLLHMAILVLLVERFRMYPVIGSAIGFIVVLIVSYWLNRKWTFGNNPSGQMAFVKYAAVSVLGLALNTGIMFMTVEVLNWRYWLGQLCVIAVVPPSNFLLNHYWAFGAKPRPDPASR